MHVHTLRIEGRLARVLRWGEPTSAPVLLLHGNPDSAELWRGVAEGLVGWCCLAPDLPGFGGSDLHEGSPTLAAMSDWLAGLIGALRKELGIRGPFHVVAHDFGGPYALSWAVRHPRGLASMTLTNTLYYPELRWHRWARIWRRPVVGEVVCALTPRWAFRRELRAGGPLLAEAHIEAAWARITPRTHRAVLALYRATDPEVFDEPVPGEVESWAERWRSLAATVPSQVLWGQRDPYLHPGWAEHLGCEKVVRFPDAGHWLPAEDPAAFADRVRALIAEGDSATALR